MARMGMFDFSEFMRLRDNINKLNDPKVKEKFMKECVQEIAMEELRRVIKRTPVSKTIRIMQDEVDDEGNKIRYKSGKNKGKVKQKSTVIHTGGTLRRGWIAETQSEAEGSKQDIPSDSEIQEYVYKLKVKRIGQTYIAWLINSVEYASYVEFGHRQMPGRFVKAIGKRLKQSWVEGQHMLQISAREVEDRLPKFLDAKLQEFLNQIFEG